MEPDSRTRSMNVETTTRASEPSPTGAIRREIAPMLRLALPLVFAEIGWMAMGIVGTIMLPIPESVT